MTCGVAAFGAEAVARVVKTIAVYDDFCHANDPHKEHDFGSFEADGHVIFFKIDLYEEPEVKGLKWRARRQSCADDHVGG